MKKAQSLEWGKIGNQIVSTAVSILESEPSGLDFRSLVAGVLKILQGSNAGTVNTTISELDQRTEDVIKPRRGFFVHRKHFRPVARNERESTTSLPSRRASQSVEDASTAAYKEADFYQPFADWLKSQSECTQALALGGNRMRGKWATPDVLGVLKPGERDFVKPPIEIVAAEIKGSLDDPVTAFGQACSYRLFSHKSYVVVPRSSGNNEDDMDRTVGLCSAFGIGLVVFDPTSPTAGTFEFEVRPRRHDPESYWVNRYLEFLTKEQQKALGF